MLKKIFLSVVIASFAISATTLILQDGLDSYSGTSDVTIFNDGKAEAYSWYDNGQKGKPDDKMLVNTEFCC